jgi:hypothetical protein
LWVIISGRSGFLDGCTDALGYDSRWLFGFRTLDNPEPAAKRIMHRTLSRVQHSRLSFKVSSQQCEIGCVCLLACVNIGGNPMGGLGK